MDFLRRMFNNSDTTSDTQSDTQMTSHENNNNANTDEAIDGVEAASTQDRDEANDADDSDVEKTIPPIALDSDDHQTDNEQDPSKITAPVQYIPDGVTRPLPAEPMMQTHTGHLLVGQVSDQGIVRSNNQDTALSFFFKSDSVNDYPDFGVFIVADGMGGHYNGEKASALTGQVVMSEILKTIYLPMLNGDDMNSADRPTISEALTESIKKANTLVRDEVKDGGTTITSLVVMANLAHFAHVGDSRAYLISRQNGIEQLTRDHSLVERLKELGTITEEEAQHHDQRNVLYRAIGQNDDLEVDTITRRLPPNSYLLLCSDGLWGKVSEDDLFDLIINTPDPQEACDKLVALANTQGGEDNITAILLKMPAQ